MTKYFFIEESPYKVGKYTINLDFDKFPSISTSGSYNILPARLMGLSYANYLRMCRDLFDADIIGKDSKYPVAYFTNREKLRELIKVLNKKMEVIDKLKNGIPKEFKEPFSKEYEQIFGVAPNEVIFKDYEK